MQRRLVQLFGVIVAILALAGIFIEGNHFLGLMNVDLPLDIARIGLAATLLYIGFGRSSEDAQRSVLTVLTVVYLALGIGGLISSTLWGILPRGLTGFDVMFHLGAGLIAAIGAFAPRHHHSAHHA
ncbi:MAG TPA: hypothetical protein VJ836_04750 [Candidatus Saccharimonadales bacterium]|nr:hypothetical protein [Candidatus Saccharimonadales bacterium]